MYEDRCSCGAVLRFNGDDYLCPNESYGYDGDRTHRSPGGGMVRYDDPDHCKQCFSKLVWTGDEFRCPRVQFTLDGDLVHR